MINLILPPDSRPGNISFPVELVSQEVFSLIADDLNKSYNAQFDQIERFRIAGIMAYEDQSTCLICHEKIKIKDAATGTEKQIGLVANVTSSVHYRFFSSRHPNVYGFKPIKNYVTICRVLTQAKRPGFEPCNAPYVSSLYRTCHIFATEN